MGKRKTKGLTLIELMMVVLIVGILFALAIPRFLKATSGTRKKESWRIMKQIYILETSYYMEHGVYCPSRGPNDIPLLGYKEPSSLMRYDYTVEPGVSGDFRTMYIVATEIEDADIDGIFNERVLMNEDGRFMGDYRD